MNKEEELLSTFKAMSNLLGVGEDSPIFQGVRNYIPQMIDTIEEMKTPEFKEGRLYKDQDGETYIATETALKFKRVSDNKTINVDPVEFRDDWKGLFAGDLLKK